MKKILCFLGMFLVFSGVHGYDEQDLARFENEKSCPGCDLSFANFRKKDPECAAHIPRYRPTVRAV